VQSTQQTSVCVYRSVVWCDKFEVVCSALKRLSQLHLLRGAIWLLTRPWPRTRRVACARSSQGCPRLLPQHSVSGLVVDRVSCFSRSNTTRGRERLGIKCMVEIRMDTGGIWLWHGCNSVALDAILVKGLGDGSVGGQAGGMEMLMSAAFMWTWAGEGVSPCSRRCGGSCGWRRQQHRPRGWRQRVRW
jgi:hypothetical protein